MLTTAIMFFCSMANPSSATNLGTQHLIHVMSEFEMTKASAEAGDTDAMTRLGSMYYLGKDTPENPQLALEWMTKAANLNEPYAQACLGLFYYEGKIVTHSNLKAYVWLFKAVLGGDLDAVQAMMIVRSQMDGAEVQKGNLMVLKSLQETI
jgi:TPR repeat protein